jgi:hypothetical protein
LKKHTPHRTLVDEIGDRNHFVFGTAHQNLDLGIPLDQIDGTQDSRCLMFDPGTANPDIDPGSV